MATIKEIAKLAGVSRGTVDRVLNNRDGVNKATADKVRQIVQALNYTPNLAGKSLAVRKKQLKFGYILFSPENNPFFHDVIRGIESSIMELKDFGVTVEIRYCILNEPQEQVRLIDELITEDIDGLVITPINHTDVAGRIQALSAQGFPVVTANSDIPDCGRIAYVGSDFFKSGETAAGLMNLICNGNANVGIIIGSPMVLCHTERVAGFTKRAKKAYHGIQIVGTKINNDDDIESYAITRKLLKEHPEIDALFLASAGVEGACRAVESLKRTNKTKIISYDTIPATCQLLERQIIAATIAQQPFTQGAKPLNILLDYLGMDMKPEREYYYTKIEIKVIENLYIN